MDSRILIVDDEPANLDLFERLLTGCGYRNLSLVRDPRLVEEEIEATHPNLVVLDVQLPYIDGLELLRRLREREGAATVQVPVLVVTADVSFEVRRRALALGANDFLTKPLDVMEVQLRVGNLLESYRLQMALADDRGRLAQMVNEKTAELSSANDQLRALVKARDEFIASVSHELRTPLTAVVAYAREFADYADRFTYEEISEAARIVAEQATEVSSIIDDLLVAARADIGAVTVLREPVDLLTELNAVRQILPEHTGREFSFPNDTSQAWGDRLRVRQILRNLLMNAIRYGGPQVEVEIQSNDSKASLVVRDNGNGVPAEILDKLFKPFASSSQLGVPASIGLGLSVSRQLARLMEGDILFKQTAGGAEFELSLPKVG